MPFNTLFDSVIFGIASFSLLKLAFVNEERRSQLEEKRSQLEALIEKRPFTS